MAASPGHRPFQGVEAHCLLTVESYVWNGVVVTSPAVIAVGNGTRGAVYVVHAGCGYVLDSPESMQHCRVFFLCVCVTVLSCCTLQAGNLQKQ